MLQDQTKSTKNTIWRPVNEQTFFKNVGKVHKASNEVPCAFQVFGREHTMLNNAHVPSYPLPLETEHQLANDFAFIVAGSDGAKSVSAATVSENRQSTGMTLTVASNAGVAQVVETALREICHELQQRSQNDNRRGACMESMFDSVTRLHKNKMLGRIESKYWTPPPHRQGSRPTDPFCGKFLESVHASIGSRKYGTDSEVSEILRASKVFQDSMDSLKGQQDIDGLKHVAREASQLSGTHSSFAERLLSLNLLNFAYSKIAKTVDKVGRYWTCCKRMAKMASSQTYGHLFSSIEIAVLKPYRPRTVSGRERHTHAEVQVITHFRLHPTLAKPRVIGTSKAACYLCNLFLSHHPQYIVSATHGVVFEPWGIPDLDAYTKEDRIELGGIIAAMNTELVKQAKKKTSFPAPAQSGIWHAPCELSASSDTTVESQISDRTIRAALPPRIEELPELEGTGATLHTSPYRHEPASGVTSRLHTMSTSYPNSIRQPTPSPGFVLPPAPSPPSMYMPPATPSPDFDYVINDLTPEVQRWLEMGEMGLSFELEGIAAEQLPHGQTLTGTILTRRITDREIPDGIRVLDVQAMTPGLDIILEGTEFVVCNGGEGFLRVVCQWYGRET